MEQSCDEELIRSLCLTFSLESPQSWKLSGGTRNRTIVLDTSSGLWMARQRHPALCGDVRLAFDHAVVAHLAGLGVSVVAPRASEQGQTWWECEDTVWEIHPFISGRAMRENDADDLIALGEALGHFHAAGRSFPLRMEKLGRRGETDPTELLSKAKELADLSPECASAVAPYRDWVEQAVASLPDAVYETLPHTLVHGDIQPGNLIFGYSGVRAFVDMDWCAWRPRIYDLAFTIPFCCATHVAPIDGTDIWSLTQALEVKAEMRTAFLEAYERIASPLTACEWAAMDAQTVLSWCHSRIFGAYKVPVGERATFLARPPFDLNALGVAC